jgi:uncharacterized protein YndB with AHSA1/START domain
MGEVRIADETVKAAPAAAVWAAGADPAERVRWHPFVTRIRGEHRLGATRSCKVDLGRRKGETPERRIPAEPGRRIAWRNEEDSIGFLRLVTDWTAGLHLESATQRAILAALEHAVAEKGRARIDV